MPTFDVEVAEPAIVRPESVVVPKPVDDTERNDEFVVPAKLVEDAMEKRLAALNP